MRTSLEKIMQDYLQARHHEPFKGHELYNIIKQLEEEIKELPFIQDNEHLKVKGSIGQGNFAAIPWLAIMDTRNTNTTQKGTYIVYLFSEDMERLYLTWNQGITKIKDEYGARKAREYLRDQAEKILTQIDLKNLKGFISGEIDLNTSSQNGRLYEAGTIIHKVYRNSELPDDVTLQNELSLLIGEYLKYIESEINEASLTLNETTPNNEEDSNMDRELQNCIESLHENITSEGFFYPYDEFAAFCISLKTKPLVLLAGISGTGKTRLVELIANQLASQDRTIPVRPDWNDSSDLLGYTNLGGNFRPGALLKILDEANHNPSLPYFICLDEMNLARVEHYFAEVLSAVEKRKLIDGELITPPVASLITNEQPWSKVYFSSNVFLIGTVNMDETTYPFSKKVLDRSNTLEFNYINLDYKGEIKNDQETTNPPNWKVLKPEYCQLTQFYHKTKETCDFVIERLKEINGILEPSQLQVGYRVRDEICLFMHYADRAGLERDTAIDLQVAQKILPRIQGSSAIIRNTLIDLWNWAASDDLSDDEIDILDKMKEPEETPLPRCAAKIASMFHRLELDGYTSFWV